MGIYEHFGARPFINAAGTYTRLGGAQMPQKVIDAMAEAAKQSVRPDELQAAASKFIARVTGAEAGYVTTGTFSGLILGTAACLAGLDVARMNRLPDTSGMPNEVLMDYHQRCGYDHAISAAGARIVNVGMPNYARSPREIYTTQAWEFETAITEHTVAIAYFEPVVESFPPLAEVIAIAKKYNLPVIIDIAHQLPPVENLRKFIAMGADLVVCSGGKGFRGPQDSGILCGRRDLIASAALQNMNITEIPSFDRWDPPLSLIPKEKLRGMPLQGIGRGMKVSKEAIIGLLTALEFWTEEQVAEDLKRQQLSTESIAACLQGISGVETEIPDRKGFPRLRVELDESRLGRSAFEVFQELKDGDPSIYVGGEATLPQGVLTISVVNLDEEQVDIVGQRLRAAIVG